MKKIFSAIIAILLCSPAFGQSFSDDPNGAFDSSVALAQEVIEDPLKLAGLQSIVFRYNRARIEATPAGYENPDWFQDQIQPLLFEINSKAVSLENIDSLPDEEKAEILAAFGDHSSDFFAYYEGARLNAGLGNIPPDQMLKYLSAYATIAYSVDSGLWDALSSFTGVWPLCFWNN